MNVTLLRPSPANREKIAASCASGKAPEASVSPSLLKQQIGDGQTLTYRTGCEGSALYPVNTALDAGKLQGIRRHCAETAPGRVSHVRHPQGLHPILRHSWIIKCMALQQHSNAPFLTCPCMCLIPQLLDTQAAK